MTGAVTRNEIIVTISPLVVVATLSRKIIDLSVGMISIFLLSWSLRNLKKIGKMR